MSAKSIAQLCAAKVQFYFGLSKSFWCKSVKCKVYKQGYIRI